MEFVVYFRPRYGHIREKPMIMDCAEGFSLIVEGNEVKHVF